MSSLLTSRRSVAVSAEIAAVHQLPCYQAWCSVRGCPPSHPSLQKCRRPNHSACVCGNYSRAGFISIITSASAGTIQGREQFKDGNYSRKYGTKFCTTGTYRNFQWVYQITGKLQITIAPSFLPCRSYLLWCQCSRSKLLEQKYGAGGESHEI